MPSLPRVDFTGRRFGRLIVTGRSPRPSRPNRWDKYWECLCDCGAVVTVFHGHLQQGHTASCGCAKRDSRPILHGETRRNAKQPAEYMCWSHIRRRCEDPKNRAFKNYGGRGIFVCERWHTYINFLADMGRRPSSKHSIERINNNGPYSPENCRWATQAEQMRNTRLTTALTYNGRTQPVTDWEIELGFPRSVIQSRLRWGWTVERALNTPVKNNWRLVTFNGRSLRLYEWEKETGIDRKTIRDRLSSGWSAEKALTEPVSVRPKR